MVMDIDIDVIFFYNFKINSIVRQMVKVFSKTSSLVESIIKDAPWSSFFLNY